MKASNRKWWKNEVMYEIYPRSFQDSNNDGIGDIQGIISRLDYLHDLGITAIWIAPMYKSPMVDMGYDISDYKKIDPMFGTLEDFNELMVRSKKLGIKIIMDLVVNHTSEEHPWFQEALADPKSKYRDYYIFRKGHDGEKPNNWRALFGGSVWSEVPGEPGNYYFHTFAKEQPDLNWENPEMRREIYDMINWWLMKGIAGFRIDAITQIKKDQDFSSIEPDGEPDGLAPLFKKGRNRPGIGKFLRELRDETFKKHDAVTIGEAYGVPPKDLGKYVGPDGYFSMIFDFSYMNIDVKNVDEWYLGRTDFQVEDLKSTIFDSQREIKAANGWYTNVLESHDQPRTLAKLIRNPDDQTPDAAKSLATLYFFLPGDPLIYQGQEIGMKNFHRDSVNDFNDISSINNYYTALRQGIPKEEALSLVNSRSRGNARVPMQWNSSKYGGFSQHEPWLEMGDDRVGISVEEEQHNPDSILNYYREMIHFRQGDDVKELFVYGGLEEIKEVPNDVMAYRRVDEEQEIAVYVNLSNKEQKLPKQLHGEVALNTKGNPDKVKNLETLLPYQSVVIREVG